MNGIKSTREEHQERYFILFLFFILLSLSILRNRSDHAASTCSVVNYLISLQTGIDRGWNSLIATV